MVIGPEGQIIGEKEGDGSGDENADDKGFCNVGEQFAIGIFQAGYQSLGQG